MRNLATVLTISLPQDRPGALAKVAETLAKAGINIDGYAEIQGVLHLLIKDAPTAREALVSAGVQVQAIQQVLVVEVENTPGAAAGVFRRIADAGMNVRFRYVAADNRLVVGVENLRDGTGLPLGGAV